MAIPTFVAAGAEASSQSAITPALPAGIATDDILVLVIETRGGQASTIADSNGGDWTLADDPPVAVQQTGTGVGDTRLTIRMSRYNGTQGDPTTNDSGDHQHGRIFAFRGCPTSGAPHEAPAGGTKTVASTTVSATGSTTAGSDRLVLVAISRENDSSSEHFSNYANADLASITELHDSGTALGNGGGYCLVTGEKASAGTYGDTTADIAASVINAFTTFALIPAGAAGAAAAAQVPYKMLMGVGQ